VSLQPGEHVTETLRLVRQIGRGAMGSVWLADHLGLQSQVAVKFISQAMLGDEVSIARFRQEAKAAAEIRSPHVVQVFDHGVTNDGVPYIVMELLEGESLDRRIKGKGPMSPLEVASVMAQGCKALGKAHERGILHRDIKPPNIFLLDVGNGESFVKLLDFGVAKFTGEEAINMTAAGNMVGTPAFMSPEQLFHGKEIDQRGDLWSFAVVAYFALTGARPFEGVTLGELCVSIKRGKFVMPSVLRGDLGPDVDAWFAHAFHADLEARFRTAKELAQAFEHAVGASTVMQSTPSGVAQALATYGGTAAPSLVDAPTPDRPRWPLLVAAAAIVGLLVGGAAAIMGSSEAPEASPAGTGVAAGTATASATTEPSAESPATEASDGSSEETDPPEEAEHVIDIPPPTEEELRADAAKPKRPRGAVTKPVPKSTKGKPAAAPVPGKAPADSDDREKKAAKTLGI
jgi:tRNA A-37 threonylcarbamoyl transferase component Bud32